MKRKLLFGGVSAFYDSLRKVLAHLLIYNATVPPLHRFFSALIIPGCYSQQKSVTADWLTVPRSRDSGCRPRERPTPLRASLT